MRTTRIVSALPSTTPFVGPEALERQNGRPFRARIGANESAFGISPMAREAILSALDNNGCSWYADPENHQLREQLADRHRVSPCEICVDGGIDSLLGLTVRALVEPGDKVVTSAGAYPTFNYHVAGFGGRLITVPYVDAHEDPASLLKAAHTEQPKILYLSNPDNPMGTAHEAGVISEMINALPPECILALDEAYIEFTNRNLAPPIEPDNPQVMRFRTFSKAYGMAGMRIGYVIANRHLIEALNKIRNHFAINRLSQLAASASLADDNFVKTVQQQVAERAAQIHAMADTHGLASLTSATNFVAVDFGSAERAGKVLKHLLARGIFLRKPMLAPLDRYIRIGMGTPAEHNLLAEELGDALQQTAH